MRTDVFVRVIELPESVRGVTLPNDDATYSVYLHARLTQAQRDETLSHELYHIEHDDLYSSEPVGAREALADLRPEENAPEYGFVRQGNVLFWQRLGPGDIPERIRPGDVVRRRVPSRSLPLCRADIEKPADEG